MANRRRKKIIPSTGSESDANATLSDLNEEQLLIYSILNEKFQAIFAKLEENLTAKDKNLKEMSDEILVLRKRVVELEDKIEDNESYERRDTVIVSGDGIPAVTDNEDSSKIVTQLIKDKINLIVNPADISVAHRLGRKPDHGPDKRKIVVKLCRRETKQDLLKACRAVKPGNFYVSESLTRTRSTVLYGLRQARKKYPNIIAGCGSQDGKVYAWIRPPKPNAPQARNIRILVKNREKFEDMCVKNFDCNPNELVSSWPSD